MWEWAIPSRRLAAFQTYDAGCVVRCAGQIIFGFRHFCDTVWSAAREIEMRGPRGKIVVGLRVGVSVVDDGYLLHNNETNNLPRYQFDVVHARPPETPRQPCHRDVSHARLP